MFYQIRYQTGEIKEIAAEMRKGHIPCMDVRDMEEYHWVIKELSNHGIYAVQDAPLDADARDRIKEPEFEFRSAFYTQPVHYHEMDGKDFLFIDFYFEPDEEETYDPIFGD